ncbi:hypothetical protein CC85DRAFT_283990 [Cutaneotrichosporon oleaginosum]|uniref:N-acetyltransferase domain-containing protein n=1 Tax=Cutaneotrichosporon oleaginosum TaxID=879819 RepID=A0A0J0XSB3_9TREE|nr:uncharacterized protein CC85DRAFT_283990 [Cutaneotrichosporon oleaginosum]KLT43947.1 hypothetical protein CC85DRAFT_283990 [Cutaneotrichosporon oleaginosum]TXT04106.1 hypothetical protein COLE_07803 [Cutaneotrichosporon oleaginosum]
MPEYPVAVPQNAPPPPAPLHLVPRDAPEDEIRAAATALAAAFEGDQIADIISGGVPGLHEARMYRTVATGVLDLEVYTVTDKEVLGVMVVKPPGFAHRWRWVKLTVDTLPATPDPSPNSEGPHGRLADELAKQKPEADEHYAVLKKTLSALEVEAFGENEVTDLFYISHIGVTPAAQGRGVGAGFCRYMVARGRAMRTPVSLLTMTEGHVSVLGRVKRRRGMKEKRGGERERMGMCV